MDKDLEIKLQFHELILALDKELEIQNISDIEIRKNSYTSSEDGSEIVEWHCANARLGVALEAPPETKESGWWIVNMNGHETKHASGFLADAKPDLMVMCFLSEEIQLSILDKAKVLLHEIF